MSNFKVGDIVNAESDVLKITNGVVNKIGYMVYVNTFPFRPSQLTLLKKAKIGQPQYKNHFTKCDLSTPSLLENILVVNEFINNMVKQEE